MSDTGSVVAFWSLAIVTVGSGVMVAAVRNLLHAALFLILSFVGIAGLYITLSADFIAVAQVLIYAGAISVLIVFAVFLTPQAGRDNAETSLRLPALGLGAMFASIVAAVAVSTEWKDTADGTISDTARAIGEALLDKYVLPFEIAGALLLVAMLGAIALVREED